MSLIVAKKNSAVIHIVSDTKLTHPEQYPKKPLAAPEDGVIKITILNSQLCIAFAGDVDPAEEAIKICRRYGFMAREIKEHLLKVNKTTRGKTEFILCIGFPEYSLYAIKDMEAVQVSSAWIGSKTAFSIFQEKALEKSSVEKRFDSNLDDAMDHVLKSGLATEVNGFRVSVSNEGNFFHYKNYMATSIPPRTYISVTNAHIIEVYGTPEEGGYSVSLCENEGRNDMVAIHVRQGEFGILYEIKNDGLLWPNVIPNVDEHEFNDILYSRFGIKAQVAFSSRQKSYLKRGNKSFANQDFINAVMFYEKGLKETEDFLRSALLFNKGLALLRLDRFNEAYEEFDKAAKIDKKLETLIEKVLFSR